MSVIISAMVALAGGATTPLGEYVGWQEHSKNDLRAWPQLLRKGGRNFKIDPNFLPLRMCRSQQRVRRKADPRGCLVLNHDTPTVNNSRDDYNTTDDVLTFLQDARFRSYFTPSDPFLITLCFKSQPAPCANTTRSVAWRSLIDDFYTEAQRLLAEDPTLHVEFVLDGDVAGGAICDCLQSRWRPWVATYIPDGGQQPGTCLKDAFTSNDPSRGLDRFAVLNYGSGQFHDAASVGYGKFVNSSFNWQIYEPRDQVEIEARLGEYAGAGIGHALNFAINIDSSMFQVWAAGANLSGRRGWSDAVVLNATEPSALILKASDSPDQRILALAYVDAKGQSSYTLSSFAGAAGSAVSSVGAGPLPVPSATASPHELSSTFSPSRDFQGSELLLASNRVGDVSALHLASSVASSATRLELRSGALLSNGSVVRLDGKLRRDGDVLSAQGAILCPGPGPPASLNATICVAQLALGAQGTLELRMWTLRPAGAEVLSSTAIPVMPPTVRVDANGAGALCSIGTWQGGSLGVAFAWADGSRVALGTARWTGDSWYVVAGPADVGVGRLPHLSFVPPAAGGGYGCGASRGVMLIVVQDGFCMDNERRNKATSPAACEQTAVATPGVLVASYGRVEDFEEKLKGDAPSMSGCDERIMHGAYSRGAAPSAAVFSNGTGFGIAALHEGSPTGAADDGECGLAHAHDGAIVLAGWIAADVCSN